MCKQYVSAIATLYIGVTFSLTGYYSIPTDGSGRVLITDINPTGNNDDDALICRSEIDTFDSEFGNWYLHPTESRIDEGDRITDYNLQGWVRDRDLVSGHRLVILKRLSDTAEEGVFTCAILDDINTPRSVGVYYPSECEIIIMIRE